MSDQRTPRLIAILTLVVGIAVPLVTMAGGPSIVLPFTGTPQGSYATTAGLQGSYSQRLALAKVASLQSSYSQGVRTAALQSSYSQGFRTAALQGSYSLGSKRPVVASTDPAATLPTRAAGLTILFAAVALGVACLPPRRK